MASVIGRAAAFCASTALEATMDAFITRHAPAFLDDDDDDDDDVVGKRRDTSEHKHVYMEIFQDYTALFESQLQAFLVEEDISTTALYAACREIHEKRRHDEDAYIGPYDWFLEKLLATIEYDEFYALMQRASSPSTRKPRK